MKNTGILGCGWLGKPLGKKLADQNYSVRGTTTKSRNFQDLKALGISPFQVRLTETEIEGEIDSFLKDLDTLIIAVPPGLRRHPESDFTAKLNLVCQKLNTSSVQTLVFVSSTSVFQNTEELPEYTEKSALNSQKVNGRQLAESENLIKNAEVNTRIVLRFGGLLGADRNPVKYFAGRENLSDGDAPVNLIHQSDAVNLMDCILNTDFSEEHRIFHGVNPAHPSRAEYYTKAAREAGLAPPKFNNDTSVSGKSIASDLTQKSLNFTFENSLL